MLIVVVFIRNFKNKIIEEKNDYHLLIAMDTCYASFAVSISYHIILKTTITVKFRIYINIIPDNEVRRDLEGLPYTQIFYISSCLCFIRIYEVVRNVQYLHNSPLSLDSHTMQFYVINFTLILWTLLE